MLENLMSLKKDMEMHDWTISSFIFYYKKNKYIVLVKRFVENEFKSDKFALVKLHFMRASDLSIELICEANKNKLLIDPKTMREYFEIEYAKNLGDIVSQFTENLGQYIPTKVPEHRTDEEKIAMIKSLSLSDSEDPRKIYCKNVKRNPYGRKRSKFNADKARLLREKLFEHFKDEKTVSFCFSMYPKDENSDAKILEKFAIDK